MVQISKASIYFMERAGLVGTRRGPVPKLAASLNAIHSYPLSPPYPAAHFKVAEQGNPPPDRGTTEVFAE